MMGLMNTEPELATEFESQLMNTEFIARFTSRPLLALLYDSDQIRNRPMIPILIPPPKED